MNTHKETVVFIIEDNAAAEPFWTAFREGKTIYGMRPVAVGAGDQMTAPSDIVEGLLSIDPEYPDKEELRELIDMAEEWSGDIARGMGLGKASS